MQNNPEILVFNVGSSTLKFALFQGEKSLLSGVAENEKGTPGVYCARIQIFDADEKLQVDSIEDFATLREAIRAILNILRTLHHGNIDVVAHRVVHGGDHFTSATRITPEVLAELEKLVPLAPLHQPATLSVIHEVASLHPEIPQVACFDTAFHATLAIGERMFGLPRKYYDEGLKRYGFHGLSFESILAQLDTVSPELARKKIVICHLGSGSSICGTLEGKSVSTTMGCTPLDGLLMGTRCGRVDPGILLYLLSTGGMKPEELSDILYHKSGLLGVSGISSDLRELQTSADPKAKETIDLFCHLAVRELGSVVAILGGLDALVFTGGIGENAPAVREAICQQLEWLGVKLNADANKGHETFLQTAVSEVPILRLVAKEEWIIATQTLKMMNAER